MPERLLFTRLSVLFWAEFLHGSTSFFSRFTQFRLESDCELPQMIKMSELDAEETEILDAFNQGGLKRSDNFQERLDKHKQYAESALRTGEGSLGRF